VRVEHRSEARSGEVQNALYFYKESIIYFMEIQVDLFGCKDDEDVLLRFGEILQLGGRKGNVQAKAEVMGKGWGINWSAFNGSLRDLEVGGIWGASEKIYFPLRLVIHNYADFSKTDPEGFKILKEILNDQKKSITSRILRS
jgi:hypothetical protein